MGGTYSVPSSTGEERKESRKTSSCSAMRKDVIAKEAVNRDVGGSGRGILLQAKVNLGVLAQNKDDADLRNKEMAIIAMKGRVEATKNMVEWHMKMAETMSGGDEDRKEKLWERIRELWAKYDNESSELERLGKEPPSRIRNAVVEKVMEHAKESMGMKKSSKDIVEID